MFLSLDGVDGGGKSTQAELLTAWLQENGREVVRCRDPGSTPLGEKIRGLLLEDTGAAMHRRTEMLLYMASRCQLVEEVIKPALAAGKTVLSDRYLLANVVYQAHAGGLPPDSVWQTGRTATDDVSPDLTIILDIDPDVAAGRMQRELDRMESQGLDYFKAVRAGFLLEAEKNPDRIVVVNAAQPVDAVQADIRAAITSAVEAAG